MLKRSVARFAKVAPISAAAETVASTGSIRDALFVGHLETREGFQRTGSRYTGTQLDDWATQIRLSKDLDHARFQARSFYRRILRRLPSLLVHYKFHEVPPREAVRAVKAYFTQYPADDPATMDRLRWQGEVTMADVVRNYLTYSHVSALLFPEVSALPRLPESALPHNATTLVGKSDNTSFLDDFIDTRPFKTKKVVFEGPAFV